MLLSQLKQCHDTIEDLKKQRSEKSQSDEDDEEGHWEDWEIAGTIIEYLFDILFRIFFHKSKY